MKKANKPGFPLEILNSFLRDKNGQIIVWQAPNVPIYGWATLKILSWIVPQSSLQTGFGQIGNAFLFVWAYLEFTQGVNYFRRTLGLLVLGLLIFNFFK